MRDRRDDGAWERFRKAYEYSLIYEHQSDLEEGRAAKSILKCMFASVPCEEVGKAIQMMLETGRPPGCVQEGSAAQFGVRIALCAMRHALGREALRQPSQELTT